MQGLFVGIAVVVGAIIIARSVKKMSEAVETALDRLTTEVSETIEDVTMALREAAQQSDQVHVAAKINEAADRLNAFQASLKAPPPPADTETAPEGGNDTVDGGEGDDA